jgi:hypothetical protein
MTNKKWAPHIIMIAAFVLFVFLGLACESSPSSYSSGSSSGSSGCPKGGSCYMQTDANGEGWFDNCSSNRCTVYRAVVSDGGANLDLKCNCN